MTYYTTYREKTPQKPPNALIKAFFGATIQAAILPPPSIENTNNTIEKFYYKH